LVVATHSAAVFRDAPCLLHQEQPNGGAFAPLVFPKELALVEQIILRHWCAIKNWSMAQSCV